MSRFCAKKGTGVGIEHTNTPNKDRSTMGLSSVTSHATHKKNMKKKRGMYVCPHIARVRVNRGSCQSCSWSAEKGKCFFNCPRLRLRNWSRETGSAVPFRVSLLISIPVLRLDLVLTYGIPPEFRGGVHLLI